MPLGVHLEVCPNRPRYRLCYFCEDFVQSFHSYNRPFGHSQMVTGGTELARLLQGVELAQLREHVELSRFGLAAEGPRINVPSWVTFGHSPQHVKTCRCRFKTHDLAGVADFTNEPAIFASMGTDIQYTVDTKGREQLTCQVAP